MRRLLDGVTSTPSMRRLLDGVALPISPRSTASNTQIADLEVLKAKLTAEVQELSARVAALPGSAVWHS